MAMIAEPLDRQALIARHQVRLRKADIGSPLSVGNGRFCFTADVTGLQTFPREYEKGIPLGTMADWGWHRFPNPHRYDLADAQVEVNTHGRTAPYPLRTNTAAARWLRANPHRFNLGHVGLVIRRRNGTLARLDDVRPVDQVLDLWTGALRSTCQIDGFPVKVETVCAPDQDAVAVRIASPLLANGRMQVAVSFPYPTGEGGKRADDWRQAARHATRTAGSSGRWLRLIRELDGTRYGCLIAWSPGARGCEDGRHRYVIEPGRRAGSMECVVGFQETVQPPTAWLDFSAIQRASAAAWTAFWQSGGAIDLSRSADPRWEELERRIVLSQYLMAVQNRGPGLPQETGLTCNSWHGKFHLEMHWWHSAHWAQWGRSEALERQLDWYQRMRPVMRRTAERQGYDGVRWGKMLGPDGREAPSTIGPLLIWQQPHPIYYAELIRRQKPGRDTLRKYQDLVFKTAEFMASFAHGNARQRCFDLGPPLLSAREFGVTEYARTKNPCFELAYWAWALNLASRWRTRLNLPRMPSWERVARHLAPLPVHNGIYVEQATPRVEDGGHPAMLAALGFLPATRAVDRATMERTLEHVMRRWPGADMWGWDFPLMAMTAARLGRPQQAVDALLLDWPRNRYLANGHNYQADALPLYLPGNGGLLAAVALMAAGWDGGPPGRAPGFPTDGSWVVRYEGFKKAP